MNYTKESIKKAFGHKLIGTKHMEEMVCRALLYLPSNLIEKVTRKVWFVGSFDDGWGFTLRGEELKKGESLIFLSDELWNQNEEDIVYTIIHEIGHVVLGHRNSIGKIQTKAEIRNQEKEADKFAITYLKQG